MITALVLLLLVFFLLGAPLFAVILGATMLGFYSADVDLTIVAVELYRIVDTPLLLALPLFTFAGYLLSAGRSSERLLNLARALFGWMPDGLAIVALITSALFTAFTGASGVTIVALGALLLPALVKSGYSEKFSLGLLTSSGSLGLLLPPSIPLILYGIVLQQMNLGQAFAFQDLLLAGLLPGLLMILLMVLWVMWVHRHAPIERTPFNAHKAWAAMKGSAWELPLPFFVLGGIFGGIFAVSEVAAVTAMYILLVQIFIYRDIKWSQLPPLVVESMTMVGGIILILGVSMAFTNYMIDAQVPNLLFEWIKIYIHDKWTFLLLLNVFLLLLGAILDIFSAIVIIAPLLIPIAVGFGIHPIHLGVIFLANMQIGYFTPPVGVNLFIASYRFNKSISELYHATIPFMFVLIGAVLLITYWPWLSLVFVEQP